jgi:hypothetical protein
MRGYRFRAWDLDSQEMCDVTSIDFAPHPKKTNKMSVRVFDGEGWHKPLTNFILVESTGQLDQGDVEIFDGDVVECKHGHVHVVEWDDSTEGGGKFWPWGDCDCCGDKQRWYTLTVIGNIHENPELIP